MLARLLQSPPLLLAGVGAVIAAAFVVPWWERDFYWDSAVFGGLAESLLAGGGYRFMDQPHGKYPPGFPLMLAAVQLLGLGVRGVHALIGVASIAAVVLATTCCATATAAGSLSPPRDSR